MYFTCNPGGRSPQGERGLKWISIVRLRPAILSFPARGTWIEMRRSPVCMMTAYRRSPQGERGLKCPAQITCCINSRSFPARGTWIEMRDGYKCKLSKRRSPQGERGLKCPAQITCCINSRRSPQGERGLKLLAVAALSMLGGSFPARGTWIEIRRETTG